MEEIMIKVFIPIDKKSIKKNPNYNKDNICVTSNHIDVLPDSNRYLYKYKKFICPVCKKLCKQIYQNDECKYCGNYLDSGYFVCSECEVEFDEIEFENIDMVLVSIYK